MVSLWVTVSVQPYNSQIFMTLDTYHKTVISPATFYSKVYLNSTRTETNAFIDNLLLYVQDLVYLRKKL